jgi:hypothetical protein
MARIRSPTRMTNEGRETEATETALILEIMRDSRMVIQREEGSVPEKVTTDDKDKTVDAKADSDYEEDDDILSSSKPSHIEFGKSTVKPDDLVLMKILGYFGKNDDELIRFVGDEIVSELMDDEVVVFKSFFGGSFGSPCTK